MNGPNFLKNIDHPTSFWKSFERSRTIFQNIWIALKIFSKELWMLLIFQKLWMALNNFLEIMNGPSKPLGNLIFEICEWP